MRRRTSTAATITRGSSWGHWHEVSELGEEWGCGASRAVDSFPCGSVRRTEHVERCYQRSSEAAVSSAGTSGQAASSPSTLTSPSVGEGISSDGVSEESPSSAGANCGNA